jgi:hypothetical protein
VLLVFVFEKHFQHLVLVLVHLVEKEKGSFQGIGVSVRLLAQKLSAEVVYHFRSVLLVVHNFHFSINLHLVLALVHVEDSIAEFLVPG